MPEPTLCSAINESLTSKIKFQCFCNYYYIIRKKPFSGLFLSSWAIKTDAFRWLLLGFEPHNIQSYLKTCHQGIKTIDNSNNDKNHKKEGTHKRRVFSFLSCKNRVHNANKRSLPFWWGPLLEYAWRLRNQHFLRKELSFKHRMRTAVTIWSLAVIHEADPGLSSLPFNLCI